MSTSDQSERGVAAVGSRREGRERVLGLLYESEAKGQSLAELIASLPLPMTGYGRALASEMTPERLAGIDARIEAASHRWRLTRMPAVDRAVLRMAVFELAHRPDVPAGAIISEAVELAGEYSTDASSRFVNGVLARLSTDLRPDEPVAVDPDVVDAADLLPGIEGGERPAPT